MSFITTLLAVVGAWTCAVLVLGGLLAPRPRRSRRRY
jgi:hypothetical protein